MATTISRELWNLGVATLARRHGADEEQVEQIVAQQYPKSSHDALFELQSRGYRATEWTMGEYAKKFCTLAGGSYLWRSIDIDDFADQLAKKGRFMEQARLAGIAGITGAELVRRAFGVSDDVETKLEGKSDPIDLRT